MNLHDIISVLSDLEKQFFSILLNRKNPISFRAITDIAGIELEHSVFNRLLHLTLVEKQQIKTVDENSLELFFVPELIKVVLKDSDISLISHGTNVANVLERDFHLHNKPNIDLALEILEIYIQNSNAKKVNEFANFLCGYFFFEQEYYRAKEIANLVEERLGEATSGRILNYLGLIHEQYGNIDEALRYHELSLDQLEDGVFGRGVSLNNIGLLHINNGSFEKAIEYFEEAIPILEDDGDHEETSKAYGNIGNALLHIGKIEESITYLEKAVKFSEFHNNKVLTSAALSNLGQALSMFGDQSKAIFNLKEALRVQREIDDIKGQSVSLNNLGLIYDREGDYERAMNYFMESISYAKSINYKSLEAKALNNLGQVYWNRAELENAKTCWKKSLRIREEIQDELGLAKTLNNLGSAFMREGEDNLALEYFERVLVIFEKLGISSQAAVVLHNISFILKRNDNLEGFFEYASAAYELALDSKDRYGIFIIGISLGETLCSTQRNVELGLNMLRTSLKIGKEDKRSNLLDIEMKIMTYSFLSNL